MDLVSLVAAAAVAAAASQAPPAGMVQATKTVCKTSASSIFWTPATCHGSLSRIAPPVACFCEGSGVRYDVPACWSDGSPAMIPKKHRLSARDFDRIAPCQETTQTPAGR